MKVNYWSNSKVIKKLREKLGFPKKPESETWDGWKHYHNACKSHNKFLDWLTDDFVDTIQNVIFWPKDKLENLSYWIYTRFIKPSHLIDTKLPKGVWHETDEKILYGLFSELEDFVEIQKANMELISHKNKKPWWDKYLPYFINRLIITRSAHHGINYLLWETSLKKDEHWYGSIEVAKNAPDYNEPTDQAKAALEILDLYCWWKYIRPMRKDPYDESGLTEFYKKHSSFEDGANTDRSEWKKMHDKCTELETKYYNEDEEMMIRLIKIRNHLWT